MNTGYKRVFVKRSAKGLFQLSSDYIFKSWKIFINIIIYVNFEIF